ncbi:hypothetical protein Tco_0968958 [Tanacetum coccineum]
MVNLENESLKDEISDLKKVIEKWTCSKVTLNQLLFEKIPENIVKALGGKDIQKSGPKVVYLARLNYVKDSINTRDIGASDINCNLESLLPGATFTEGDAINFNENRSFLDDEFLEPRSKVTQCSGYIEYFSYIPAYENITPTHSLILQDSVSPKEPHVFTSADDHPALTDHVHTESTDNLEPAKI